MGESEHRGPPRHPTRLPGLTIGDYLAAVAGRGPRPYAELALDVERVACGLLALGVEKGDRIAIWAPDSTEWTLVQLAAARAGAVLVILDGEWTNEELGAVLGDAQVRLLVVGGAERLGALESAREQQLVQVERLVAIDGQSLSRHDDLTWPELIVAGSSVDPALLAQRAATLHPSDPVSIEYERLAGGELRATTLTHRDYLASTGQ